MSDQKTREKLGALASLLDTRFKGPFGIRFGLDALIGLIPGIGDVTTTLLSLAVVWQAVQLGCPPSVILRMAGNILVENIVDMIPIAGNLFDFFWRANTRNVTLLDAYLAKPIQVRRKSSMLMISILALLVLAMLGALYGGILAVTASFQWLARQIESP